MSDEKFELISYDGKSFAGISKSDSVFIDFTKMRKNQGFVELMGKQGTKKTSTLLGVAYAMGAQLSLDKKRLFNSIDGDIEEELIGKMDGEEYKVEVAASRIAVKRKIGDKWKNADDDTPAAMIKKLFGSVGLFPMHVKEMKPRQQIEFFQSMFGSGEEASKKMQKLEADYDKKFADRRDINRDANLLKGALEVEPLFQNYEASLKKFAKPISADKEKAKYEQLKKDKGDFDKYNTALEGLKESLTDTTDEIAELEKKLAAAKELKKDLEARVEKGDKWIEDNKAIVKDFATAEKEWMNLSQTLTDYNKWKDIQKKEATLIEKQEQSATLTGELDELNEKILKATNDCLPKVKGLTAKVATGIDKNGKPEGMFFLVPGKKQEQPIHELSETEYADMWCEIWNTEGTQFIFIENMSSFGDTMIETLNQFVKNGGTVFYTQMKRQQENLSVTFKSKID
jgi:hypothetical protein